MGALAEALLLERPRRTRTRPSPPNTSTCRSAASTPGGTKPPSPTTNSQLLPVATEDAAGNVTRVENNYRVLAPWLSTDPNLNRNGVRYDALGMVVATAAMGKLLGDGSDEGDTLDTSTDEPSPSDDPTTKRRLRR